LLLPGHRPHRRPLGVKVLALSRFTYSHEISVFLR
jgi:hypothetical protein